MRLCASITSANATWRSTTYDDFALFQSGLRGGTCRCPLLPAAGWGLEPRLEVSEWAIRIRISVSVLTVEGDGPIW